MNFIGRLIAGVVDAVARLGCDVPGPPKNAACAKDTESPATPHMLLDAPGDGRPKSGEMPEARHDTDCDRMKHS